MPVVETFFGHVETTKDSLLLLEACRRGRLPRVRRRLQEQERQLVKSGAVFCFDENESGIKRWTDGLVWSPSRILGNFLIYRELDDRKNANDDQDGNAQLITSGLTLLSKRQRQRSLVGSLRKSYRFKPNGLVKKSLSVVVNGVNQHLVSYYNKEDVLANKFQTPTDTPELASIEISTALLCGQNFRIPFLGNNSQNANSFGKKKGVTIKRSATDRTAKQKRSFSTFDHQPSRRRYDNYGTNLISSPPPSIATTFNSNPIQEKSSYSTTTNGYETFSMNNELQLLSDTSATITPTTTTNAVYSSLTYNKYQRQQQDLLSPEMDMVKDCFYLPSPANTNHHKSTENQSMKCQLSPQADFTEEYHPLLDCQDTFPPNTRKFTSIIPETRLHLPNHHKQQQIDSISPTITGIPHSFSTGYSTERLEQNPHQYLFSSTSLHSVMPTRTTELISNAFMLDTNALLGSGWNDFEMQM